MIHIGTSGWQYRDWKGAFYPNELRQADWLEHYARHFQTVEVNNAFYRLPEASTFEQWAARTPDDFVVAVKASRFLTHIRRLDDAEEPVARFCDHARHLGEKLGPVLLQLPPSMQIDLDRLAGLLAPLRREASPFAGSPKLPRTAVFVEPRLVAEIEFREWTPDGMLRAPSYKGLRDDKPAELVVREESAKAAWIEVEGREVKLSNPAKVLYPAAGFTKRDLVDYFVAIAPVLLPHLLNRPLTLKRYPDGVEGKHFFEKQSPSHRPDWVQTVSVPSERRKRIDFTLANDLPTLVWLANLADLEFHTQLHVAQAPERPTVLVFDLDPGAPATIVECCRVGVWLQGMFEGLRIQSFAKTSGSKGLQVYVPLNAEGVTYDDHTKPLSQALARHLEAEHPELVVSSQKKELRKGKVLIDWSQNDEHKTTVCVYSLRARERPTVSTPVTWDEVRACHEAGDAALLTFTTEDVLRRVASEGDLFAPVLSLKQKLPKL